MERLAIDFVRDSTVGGRKVRVLTVVDKFSGICPLLEVAHSMTGRDVVKALEKISAAYGVPKAVRMDNGPELRSRAMVE
jgi:putative transposase